MAKPSTTEVIGAVVLSIMLLIMMMQGDRIWDMLERLVRVETIVEAHHE